MFTKDKKFYSRFFSLFWVLVIQNVIILGVNLADNIMLGMYDQNALAGVTAVNQLQFFFQQIILGIGDAAVVLGSQYFGQRRTEPIKSIAVGALCLGVGMGAVLTFAAAVFPEGLVRIFSPSAQIVAEGAEYIRIIKYSYIIFAVTNVLLAVMRCVEKVRIAFFVSLSTLLVNCSLNVLLIFGLWGFPELGTAGAAIATLISRVIELIIVLCYVFVGDKRLALRIKDIVKSDVMLLRDYFRLSPPFVCVAGMFGVSTALQTVILGYLDDNAIAANSAASTLFLVLKVASVGAASASAIIIGKTVGMGDVKRVREYSKALQFIYLVIGLFTAVALFFLRYPIINMYTELTAEAREMAHSFILVLCVTSIGTAYEMPVITGIIRGGGDSKFVLINDIISIWCIVLPVSFLAAFVFHLSPVIVIFCLNADQIFKCGAAAIKVNRYRWMKKLTRPEQTPVSEAK